MTAPTRALILGGVAWNTMVYVDRFPAPEPQTVFPMGYHETLGSSGAGKALNLAYLGAEVRLWAMLGDDEPGRRARAYLARTPVTLETANDPTGTTRHINLMDRAGDRISIFANGGADDLSVHPAVIEPWLEGIDICAITIVAACKPFLPVIEREGVDVWCDLHDYDGKNPYHREFIDGAAHLQLTSVAFPQWRRFMEQRIEAGTKSIVCTHGAQGASALTAQDGWVDLEAQPVPDDKVVDTNGAGDAFFAGFAVARHRGAELAAAVERGVQTAAAAVQSPELSPMRPSAPPN